MGDRHFFPIPGRPPCPECGQPEGVDLHISHGGYSVGGGIQHKPECPRLRCSHGVPWQEDCARCADAARLEDDDE